MIVTRSRLHAVRYKRAVDRYLKEKGYPFKALVAFSGTVRDGGADYTEANMNGFPEAQTAETFKRDEYRMLIVAYKFQTGFDQPLLHTMYVDKKLGGVNAVQTLSRLNRVAPGKSETFVLDFVNDADEIQKAFEPYYDRTLLKEATDPNLLYDLQTKLSDFISSQRKKSTDSPRCTSTPKAPRTSCMRRYNRLSIAIQMRPKTSVSRFAGT
jgi:type I restriction enzyme R subunit